MDELLAVDGSVARFRASEVDPNEPWFQFVTMSDPRLGAQSGGEQWLFHVGPSSVLQHGLKMMNGRVSGQQSVGGGTAYLADGTDPSGTPLLAAAWRGDWHCVYMLLPPGLHSLQDASRLFADLEIFDQPDGLTISGSRWRIARLLTSQFVPKVGRFYMTLGPEGSRGLPNWRGQAVGVGEVWRLPSDNGVEELILASTTAVLHIVPFQDVRPEVVEMSAGSVVPDGRAAALQLAASATELSWTPAG